MKHPKEQETLVSNIFNQTVLILMNMNKLIIILSFFPLLSFAQITVSEIPKFIEEVEVKKPLQIDSLSDWKDDNEESNDESFDYNIYKGVQIYFPNNTIDCLSFYTETSTTPSINEMEVFTNALTLEEQLGTNLISNGNSGSGNSGFLLDTVYKNINSELKNILLSKTSNIDHLYNRQITVVNPQFHKYYNETSVYADYYIETKQNGYSNKYFNILDVFTTTDEIDSISKLLGDISFGDKIFKLQEKETNNEPIYCNYKVLKKSILLPRYVKFKDLFEGKEFVIRNRMSGSQLPQVDEIYDFENKTLTKEVFYDFNNQQLIEAKTNSVWICKELTLFNNFDMRFFKNTLNVGLYNGLDNLPLEDRKKMIVSYEDYLNGKDFSNHNELKKFKDNSQNKLFAPYLVLQNKLHPEQLIAIEFNKDVHYKKFIDFEYDESNKIIYPEDEIPGFILKDRYDSMKLLLKIKRAKGDAETLKENEKKRIQQQKEKEVYRINQLKHREEIIEKYGQEIGTIIANGKVRIGMTKQMCIDSWGNSIISNKTTTEEGTFERIQYGSGVLYFTNGVLKRIEQ